MNNYTEDALYSAYCVCIVLCVVSWLDTMESIVSDICRYCIYIWTKINHVNMSEKRKSSSKICVGSESRFWCWGIKSKKLKTRCYTGVGNGNIELKSFSRNLILVILRAILMSSLIYYYFIIVYLTTGISQPQQIV